MRASWHPGTQPCTRIAEVRCKLIVIKANSWKNTSLIPIKVAWIPAFLKDRTERGLRTSNKLWVIYFVSRVAEGPGTMRGLCFSPLLSASSLWAVLPPAISYTASFHSSDHKRYSSAPCPPLSKLKNKSCVRLYSLLFYISIFFCFLLGITVFFLLFLFQIHPLFVLSPLAERGVP